MNAGSIDAVDLQQAASLPDARPWTYDELVREGVALIPPYAPAWTNHNASDPGITLIELFAYFSEVLAYRALRITPDAKFNFLRLLNGSDHRDDALIGQPTSRIDDAIRSRIDELSEQRCLVTAHDIEDAARALAAAALKTHQPVRALALPGIDLSRGTPTRSELTAGDFSVVLAPARELAADDVQRLCEYVRQGLEARCLLSTRVHVVAPTWLHVDVGARLALDEGASLSTVMAAIDDALRRRFGPAIDDDATPEQRPFGRPLHLTEIVEVIDRVEGVDWVEQVDVMHLATRRWKGDAAEAESAVGIRVGVVSSVASDTRFGGLASQDGPRFERDSVGEVATVLLHPWEQVRVRLLPSATVQVDAMTGGAMS